MARKRKLVPRYNAPSEGTRPPSSFDDENTSLAAEENIPSTADEGCSPSPSRLQSPLKKTHRIYLEVDEVNTGEPSSKAIVSAESNGEEPQPTAEAVPQPNGESEPLRSLIEPLSKEQLIDLLILAASCHPDVYSQVADVASRDPAHRKIFIHGLGWDTGTEMLASAFSQFGEIEDCNVVQDKPSGKSKGYGFVLFKHRSSAREALKEPQKKIGNRMTACQLASAGPVPTPVPITVAAASDYTQRKIYVSNVGAGIDPHKLLQFFAKYGEIVEGPLGLDKETGKPKGFCLFVYSSAESARKALEEPHKNFEGHVLYCQRAIDGPKALKSGWNQSHGWGGQHQSGGYSGGHFAKTGYAISMSARSGPTPGSGHLATVPQAVYGQNVQTAAPGFDPALGQALTTLLANPNAALGLSNLLGSIGSAAQAVQAGSQAVPPNTGSHGNQSGVVGGFGVAPYGAGRVQQGAHFAAGPPYMGH